MEGAGSTMDDMLIDIRCAAYQGNVSRTFGPMEVYVVGFEGTVPHPMQYLYHGCTAQVCNGRLCCKTVKGQYRCRIHNSVADGTWKPMFRFDVFLADGSLGRRCPPLRASLFDAANDLLGLPAHEMDQKNEVTQGRLVSNAISKFPFDNATIQVRNGVVTLGEFMADVDTAPPLPAFSRLVTPPTKKVASTKSQCDFVYKTPPSAFLQKVGNKGESLSSSRQESRTSRKTICIQELTELQKKFDDLMDGMTKYNCDGDSEVEVINISEDEG